jgi:hypothetical protein
MPALLPAPPRQPPDPVPVRPHHQLRHRRPDEHYACAAATVTAARSFGLVAELESYSGPGQKAHANDLYKDHQDETDTRWTTFLTRELAIYSGMPAAEVEPVCPRRFQPRSRPGRTFVRAAGALLSWLAFRAAHPGRTSRTP